MRPIDADTLYANIGHRHMFSGESVGGFINNSPTIDAIPVEWLEKKRKEALHEGMRPDEVEAVEMVIWMWQKEQEAR